MPGSICDILPSTAALLGVPDATDTLGLRERVGDVQRVVLVLVDGLGYHLLPQLTRDAPLLASVLAGTDVRMGIIPAGTGNLLARNVEILLEDLEALRVVRPGTCGQNQF